MVDEVVLAVQHDAKQQADEPFLAAAEGAGPIGGGFHAFDLGAHVAAGPSWLCTIVLWALWWGWQPEQRGTLTVAPFTFPR